MPWRTSIAIIMEVCQLEGFSYSCYSILELRCYACASWKLSTSDWDFNHLSTWTPGSWFLQNRWVGCSGNLSYDQRTFIRLFCIQLSCMIIWMSYDDKTQTLVAQQCGLALQMVYSAEWHRWQSPSNKWVSLESVWFQFTYGAYQGCRNGPQRV